MKRMPDEEFAARWQEAPSLPAAAKATRMNVVNCSQRASRMRAKGVDLKRFVDVGPRMDEGKVERLNEIAKKALKG